MLTEMQLLSDTEIRSDLSETVLDRETVIALFITLNEKAKVYDTTAKEVFEKLEKVEGIGMFKAELDAITMCLDNYDFDGVVKLLQTGKIAAFINESQASNISKKGKNE